MGLGENWSVDIEAELLRSGNFAAVLVLRPPPDVGPPLRYRLEGEHDSVELAEWEALDAFAAMTRRLPSTSRVSRLLGSLKP